MKCNASFFLCVCAKNKKEHNDINDFFYIICIHSIRFEAIIMERNNDEKKLV